MISHKAHEILCEMLDAENCDDLLGAEIAREGRQAWIGDRRCSSRAVTELLRWCLIRDCSCGSVERYMLNEDGRRAVKDRTYVPPELIGKKREEG